MAGAFIRIMSSHFVAQIHACGKVLPDVTSILNNQLYNVYCLVELCFLYNTYVLFCKLENTAMKIISA